MADAPATPDPHAEMWAFLDHELSPQAAALAHTLADDTAALRHFLEGQLPMASFGYVQSVIGTGE